MPGEWAWRIEYRRPDGLRFTLRTSGEDQAWETDADSASTFLGGARVTRERLAGSDAQTLVRWVGAMYLDVLSDPTRFAVRELPRTAFWGCPGAALEATALAPPAARYRLCFDDALRLVAMEGPLQIPLIGNDRVRVELGDHRQVEGWRLPFAARYSIAGRVLVEEAVVEQRVAPLDDH